MRQTLTSVLREALSRVDDRGRFTTEDTAALRASVGRGIDPREHPDTPSALFGDWETLLPQAQAAFCRAVEDHIRGTMDWFPQGSLWEGLVRGGWELDRYWAERGVAESLREGLIRGILAVRDGPVLWRNRLTARSSARRWRRDARPSISDLIYSMGRDPQWLLGDFVEGVEVDRRARGFYHDPTRNSAFGYVVGLDLLWTGREMVCLEGNLQRGIGNLRHEVQPDHPLEGGIIQAAIDHGARRVFWIEGHRKPVTCWFHDSLLRNARDAGLQLEFIDDPRKRRCRDPSEGQEIPWKGSWLEAVPDDSLVIRRNEFPVGSDFVINDKEPFIRGLARELEMTGDTRIRVLPQTRLPPSDVALTDDGFPNLVYKYPDGLGGKEVFFLRAEDADHAVTLADELDARYKKGPGLFQAFTLPALLPGDRVWDMSTEIFVAPTGVWFLGAIRREASRPIPRTNGTGIVQTDGTLTSNQATGGTLHRVMGKELELFRESTMATGEALRSLLARTFQTGPTRSGVVGNLAPPEAP